MKILFNAYNCTLGNNGGTQTIIRSCETLNDMGNEACILAKVNAYTLNPHKAPIIKDIPINGVRYFDAVINVSAWEIQHTLSLEHPNSYWWLRLWEDYVVGVDIKKYITKIPMLVNSIGLQRKLESYGVESQLIPQGIDDKFWHCVSDKPDKPRIGILAHTKERKRFKDALAIVDKMGDKFQYSAVGESRSITNVIRGQLKVRNIELSESLNKYRMRDFYSLCNIWLQTSDSEGLCNMAMEAALCDCLIIANVEGLSGIEDYHQYVLTYFDVDHACTWLKQYPDKYIERFVNNCKTEIKSKIGSRECCMEKMIKAISPNSK